MRGLINGLTTILLVLLTFLLTTMPSTTTTTNAIAIAIASASASATVGTSTTATIVTNGQTQMQFLYQHRNHPNQAQQLKLWQCKQMHRLRRSTVQHFRGKLLDNAEQSTFDVISPGTQLLTNDENFIASLYAEHESNAYGNAGGGGSTTTNNNIVQMNHMRMKNMDYNSLDEQQGAGNDEPTLPPPTFDFGMPRNITARSGQPVTINCRVESLGDKSVSWIRKRDLHILTAGIITYTSDERFQVVRTADSKDWTLHIRYAQPRDTGIYECQVNTEPKISMAFRLNVIVTPPDAKASITGPADLYVKVGSAITLTCLVKQPSSAQDIGPIYWYRGPYILTPFVAHPNEAAIDLQRISMESKLGEQLQSRLRIANAQPVDSGNYTCMPTTADAASVMVNVINDESPAAMQKSAAPALEPCSALDWCRQLGVVSTKLNTLASLISLLMHISYTLLTTTGTSIQMLSS